MLMPRFRRMPMARTTMPRSRRTPTPRSGRTLTSRRTRKDCAGKDDGEGHPH